MKGKSDSVRCGDTTVGGSGGIVTPLLVILSHALSYGEGAAKGLPYSLIFLAARMLHFRIRYPVR